MAESTPTFPQLPPLPTSSQQPEPIPAAPPATPLFSWDQASISILGLSLILSILIGLSRRPKKQKRHCPLQKAHNQLQQLSDSQPLSTHAAQQSAHIICQSFARYYREPQLDQNPISVLQKRSFIRQLPRHIRPSLFLFLSYCIEHSYRHQRENPPAEQFTQFAHQLLHQSQNPRPSSNQARKNRRAILPPKKSR